MLGLLPLVLVVTPLPAPAINAPLSPTCAAPTGMSAGVATFARPLASPVAARAEPDVQEYWRAEDGLFYATAEVNGTPIRFLIDTGASMIVLRPEDAHAAGIGQADVTRAIRADTASGGASMAGVKLRQVRMGATEASAVSAAIAPSGLGISLLGQNWLSYFRSVTIEGDRMTLR